MLNNHIHNPMVIALPCLQLWMSSRNCSSRKRLHGGSVVVVHSCPPFCRVQSGVRLASPIMKRTDRLVPCCGHHHRADLPGPMACAGSGFCPKGSWTGRQLHSYAYTHSTSLQLRTKQLHPYTAKLASPILNSFPYFARTSPTRSGLLPLINKSTEEQEP